MDTLTVIFIVVAFAIYRGIFGFKRSRNGTKKFRLNLSPYIEIASKHILTAIKHRNFLYTIIISLSILLSTNYFSKLLDVVSKIGTRNWEYAEKGILYCFIFFVFIPIVLVIAILCKTNYKRKNHHNLDRTK